MISVSFLKSFTLLELIGFSIVANVATFLGALLLGASVRGRRVAPAAPPVTRQERVLATVCVVLNTVVMIVGWLLFNVDIITVRDDGPWLLDACILVLAMDLAMYVTHRIAHHPWIFRHVHSVHHRYDAPRPLTLFVLHPLEVVGFGGLWLMVLMTHTFSLGGILLYLAINTAYGTLAHTGVEPLPFAFVGTFHADHHATPAVNYGFYTPVWDRLLRTSR